MLDADQAQVGGERRADVGQLLEALALVGAFAFGALMTMARSLPTLSHQHVVADQADGEAFDLELVFRRRRRWS